MGSDQLLAHSDHFSIVVLPEFESSSLNHMVEEATINAEETRSHDKNFNLKHWKCMMIKHVQTVAQIHRHYVSYFVLCSGFHYRRQVTKTLHSVVAIVPFQMFRARVSR